VDPSRASPPSSPPDRRRVNSEAARQPLFSRRRFTRIERGIRTFQPRFPEPPPKPSRSDEVLDALAAAYRPGDRIGTVQIMATGGVRRDVADAIRKWARSRDLWPYLPRINGFPARWRRKGGGT
jgi:hypothetical protein